MNTGKVFVVRPRKPGAKWYTSETGPQWLEVAGRFPTPTNANAVCSQLNHPNRPPFSNPNGVDSLPLSMEVQQVPKQTKAPTTPEPEQTPEPPQPAQTRDCYAIDCHNQVPKHILMCRSHWAMVPYPVQQSVYRYQEIRKQKPTDRAALVSLANAAHYARVVVAKKEGKEVPDNA